MSVWTSIPVGTVPQRPRAARPQPTSSADPVPSPAPSAPPEPAPTPTPAPLGVHPSSEPAAGRAAAAPAPVPRPTALEAPTTAVEEDPTNRLSAHLLVGRTARPGPPPTRIGPWVPPPPPRLGPPVPAPLPAAPARPAAASSSRRGPLPFLALVALLLLGVAVLMPWPGSGPRLASSPVGLVLLTGLALLVVPLTIDVIVGRDRAAAMLVGLPLMAAAAAGTVLVSDGDLAAVLAAQGLDVHLSMAPGMVAVALLGCLLVGIVGAARRPGPAGTVGVPAVVVGVCVGISTAAVAALVIALGGASPETATVATTTGTTPTASASGTGGGSSCPAEAARTLPEAAVGAPVVAHDSRVHVAICEGASGALYYYGADDRTRLTITLPATRSEDSWIATNNGVTYSITPDTLIITKAGGITLADEALTAGWSG